MLDGFTKFVGKLCGMHAFQTDEVHGIQFFWTPRRFETVNGRMARIMYVEDEKAYGYLEGTAGIPQQLSWNRNGACLEHCSFDILGSGAGRPGWLNSFTEDMPK